MTTAKSDYYTDELGVRAELCNTILRTAAHLDRAVAAGLVAADLERVRDHGLAAKAADAEQQVERAGDAARRGGEKTHAETVFARESDLKELLPLVLGDLERAGEREAASTLSHLSFRRYRVRSADVAVPAEVPGPVEAVAKKVERVERSDKSARAAGLAAFVSYVLETDAVKARFVARKTSEDWLRSLRDDALAVEKSGANRMRPASATEREVAESRAARAAWSEVRRRVRKVAQTDPDLARLYAAC